MSKDDFQFQLFFRQNYRQNWKLLTIFQTLSILDVWQGSEYTSEFGPEMICHNSMIKIIRTSQRWLNCEKNTEYSTNLTYLWYSHLKI